jgi:hypothetical protein
VLSFIGVPTYAIDDRNVGLMLDPFTLYTVAGITRADVGFAVDVIL